jgi:8-oxo-dGTP pyrophosphatase MutT (NUDIX family)
MEHPAITAVRRILSQNPKKALVDPSLTPAGVMLLMYPEGGELRILLNKRSESVEDHKGEIAFPGGRKDEADRTLLDTALRETYEEMGVRPQDVDVLGELDDVPTNSNYLINAYVGTIPPSYPFQPNEREVAEVLEIPVAELRDSGNLRDEVRIVDGGLVSRPSYAYRGHLIYGATARVLAQFLGLLDGVSDEEALWKRGGP